MAVFLIVLLITSDIAVTVLVGICVIMTDIFLISIVYFWNLSMNFLVMLNVVVAIGISVDYSAHIAYAYLTTPIPKTGEYDTDSKVRHYKTRMALRKMGVSVFHGGFSTFIAILSLGFAKTYIFDVFYHCWTGIILFGLLNGFLLLPTLLSMVGPI